MAIDVALAADLGALFVSAFTTIAGITPPATATQEQKSKVSKDVFGQYHLASGKLVIAVQALIVAFAALQAQAIVRADRANDASSIVTGIRSTPVGAWLMKRLATSSVSTASRQTSFAAQEWLLDSTTRNWFRIGCAVGALGGVLRVVCFRTLGRFFTFDLAVHDGHKVIQTGPYSIVRHPSYTAMLLLWTGEVFAKAVHGPLVSSAYRTNAWYAAAVGTLVVLVLMALRIRDEERMLQKELGKEYKEYMNKVPARLIPFLF